MSIEREKLLAALRSETPLRDLGEDTAVWLESYLAAKTSGELDGALLVAALRNAALLQTLQPVLFDAVSRLRGGGQAERVSQIVSELYAELRAKASGDSEADTDCLDTLLECLPPTAADVARLAWLKAASRDSTFASSALARLVEGVNCQNAELTGEAQNELAALLILLTQMTADTVLLMGARTAEEILLPTVRERIAAKDQVEILRGLQLAAHIVMRLGAGALNELSELVAGIRVRGDREIAAWKRHVLHLIDVSLDI